MSSRKIAQRNDSRLATPNDLEPDAGAKIHAALNGLVADAFALYVKCKHFHWHVTGPHFSEYHRLLDEHANQILATIDPLAERVRKLGGVTLRSVSEISKLQSIADNDAVDISARDIIAELIGDNRKMCAALKKAHGICDESEDVATASLIEIHIDETEKRIWFLHASLQPGDVTGH